MVLNHTKEKLSAQFFLLLFHCGYAFYLHSVALFVLFLNSHPHPQNSDSQRVQTKDFLDSTEQTKPTQTGQCLEGGTFKRCGVDTLWYVTGTNTQYQLHHRPLEDGEDVSWGRNEVGTYGAAAPSIPSVGHSNNNYYVQRVSLCFLPFPYLVH